MPFVRFVTFILESRVKKAAATGFTKHPGRETQELTFRIRKGWQNPIKSDRY
jgi:hypothetical protein